MPLVVYRGNKRQLRLWDGTRLPKHRSVYLTPEQFDSIEEEDKEKFAIIVGEPPIAGPVVTVFSPPVQSAPVQPPVQEDDETEADEEKVTDGRTE